MHVTHAQLLPQHCHAGAILLLLAVMIALFPGCRRKPVAAPATARATTAVAAPIPPAPKPTGPLASNASCITTECHARYQAAPQIHGPVSQGSCMSCHQPDQGNHHYPLARTGNDTCTFCHAVSGTKPHQHKAVDQLTANTKDGALSTTSGGCLNCHDPHASSAKFLLTASNTQALCVKCHNVPLKRHVHKPFAAGQCTVCHQAHQSEYQGLLRGGEGPEHCFSCHTEKQRILVGADKARHIHPAALQSCTACHGPHATDNPRQMKLAVNETCISCHKETGAQIAKSKHVHGALNDPGNCASCHDAHGSNNPAELKARTDKLCLTCHTDAIKTKDGRTIAAMGPVLASANLHGPVKAGACSECHKPHAADNVNLLKQNAPDGFYQKFDIGSYALCFSCHEKQLVLKDKTTTLTNFRDGDRNLHFVHVNREEKGRTCKTCHDVHGSNLPRHMAASVPFDGSNWSMPLQFVPTKTGGTCTNACHDERTYNRGKTVTTQPLAPQGGKP